MFVKDFDVRTTDAETVAFLEMHGPYSQTPEGYGQLYGWLAQRGLQPSGMPGAVYLTTPGEVPEEDARWELWAPVAGDPPESAPDDAGVGVKRVPETLVVSAMHRGPYETVAPTYQEIWEYMQREGLAMDGPPMERYHSDPATVAPQDYLTEVLIPVRRA